MGKLNFFSNGSKAGMEFVQLPPSLKHLLQVIPYRDCNEFVRLPLGNLKSLKKFTVKTRRSVRLPQQITFPASLQVLELNSCEQLPETFGHLSALQNLGLDKSDLKCLPQAFTQCVALKTLSMQSCTNVISLPDNIFASLSSLEVLLLKGCTRLEKLPAELGTLTALQNLNIGECENLRALPENFGELKSLKILSLNGCISLQRLPDSFGMLRIECLTLQSLASLKGLPQSIGDLSCLKSLTLISCQSLEFFPESLVQLTSLDTFVVKDCIKLGALPKNFDQLCSLKNITLSDCSLLTRLPHGFQAVKTLKVMVLTDCRNLLNLPACFEMLSCLEELFLFGLFISDLPDGLVKLKKLRILSIRHCCRLQTLPQDFENLTILKLWLTQCGMLEGTTMDKIVKLQNCWYVNIHRSPKLIKRWNELEENKSVPMIMQTSWKLDEKELHRALKVGLLLGKCIELDSTRKELIHHSSLSIPNNTTIAVISLQMDQPQLFQQTVDMAEARARSNCGGKLWIIYVCRRSDDSDAPTEHEEEEIRKMMLFQGISYAIPSTDIRRLSLIGDTIFSNPNVFSYGTGPEFLCFMVDIREDDEGHQILKDAKRVTEDEISKKTAEKLPITKNSDGEIETPDMIVEFINYICESKTQSPSRQCSRLPEDNMVGEFIQKLKNNGITHFMQNKVKNKDIDQFRVKEVKVDHLQGKTVAIILADQNSPECMRLRQIYHDFKLKHSKFEVFWLPLPGKKDFGFGTYSRAIQCMPWLTLADPKLIKVDDIEDKRPRVIIINSGGNIGNPNALSLLMSWGADAYPFTKESLNQLDLKSNLEILFHSTVIKELNKKLIFLYAEPPSQKLKMKYTLEKLVQIHAKGNFEIIYVGRFFAGTNVAEVPQKAYEDATESMNWTKLSFGDMMTFWYRCKYFCDEVLQKPKSASTLKRLVKALLNEKRWLVVVDDDGMVTGNGMDVVEMACESSDDKDDEVEIIIKKELRESLREGKCSEGVRRYFRDELNHPEHGHPSRPRWQVGDVWQGGDVSCDRCYQHLVLTSSVKRIYGCDACNWDICSDCWKQFVKEVVRRQPT